VVFLVYTLFLALYAWLDHQPKAIYMLHAAWHWRLAIFDRH